MAGSIYGNGSIYIPIFKRDYKASRLAWLYVYGREPKDLIDHIDGNPLNNTIENLREATKQQNQRNQRIRYNNSSGFKGVHLHKPNGRWRAIIGVNGRSVSLGNFKTREEAHQARMKAEKEIFGEFSRSA